MKDETRKAILARSTEEKQEIIALLAEDMQSDLFAGALCKPDSADELTDFGSAILDALREIADDELPTIDEREAERLHEAICEGRRNDAIYILRDITGVFYRDAEAQENLFPSRVPATDAKSFASRMANF